MNVLDQLNSMPLYLISGGIILFMMAMSLFFLRILSGAITIAHA